MAALKQGSFKIKTGLTIFKNTAISYISPLVLVPSPAQA
jgi:hypothetical protein